jgi:hypothetical protein
MLSPVTFHPMNLNRREFVVLAAGAAASVALRSEKTTTSSLVHLGPNGRLMYTADTKGNTIPDFSNAGYGGGGIAIPEAANVAEVLPGAGDATERIQAAIDKASQLPVRANGVRGAVLLRKGRYAVGGSLNITASGVVLRGEGPGEDGTVLIATGKQPRTLINVSGADQLTRHSAHAVVDDYVPVGARKVRVDSTEKFKVGDTILIVRTGNDAWLHEIGMDRITPRPGHPDSTHNWSPFKMNFDRVITGITGDTLEVDAPIACAIETPWGGGEVRAYENPGRILQAGIENLRGDSEFDRSIKAQEKGRTYFSDEDHAVTLISIDQAVNAWVRNVSAVHFNHACVSVGKDAKWVTVEDCTCTDMVSEITGERRYAFEILGQLVLMQRCMADTARHSFVVGARVCGPNVFLNCKAGVQYATSEPHHRWSVGGLYDNVHADIAIQDRQWMGSGHGWAGANYVAWNCEGSLVCQKPPTAQNYAIGQVGRMESGAFDRPKGYWESIGKHVSPASLYAKQLEDRVHGQ